MFKRILVPLDGSSFAERAIPHAEYFARLFNGKIILLRVLETNSGAEGYPIIDLLGWQVRKAEGEMYLKTLAERIQEHLGDTMAEESRVEYTLQEGRAAENIVNFAKSQKIDLVIISTHGSSGASPWNIGSVTQKVINRVYLPVLLIRSYQPVNTEAGTLEYRKILLPIDNSRRAECVLSAGITLTQVVMPVAGVFSTNGVDSQEKPSAETPPRTRLILATVIKPLELAIPKPYKEDVQQLHDQIIHASRKAALEYLNELKLRIGMGCEVKVLENESITAAIHQLVEQENVDLVLMSAHGYSGQFSTPYGGITRNYLEEGTRPVLIIQDVPGWIVRATGAETAAEMSGGR